MILFKPQVEKMISIQITDGLYVIIPKINRYHLLTHIYKTNPNYPSKTRPYKPDGYHLLIYIYIYKKQTEKTNPMYPSTTQPYKPNGENKPSVQTPN